MKLLLLHGPAIKASRIKLQELRSKFPLNNVMEYEEEVDITTILTNIQSIFLFDDERLIIVENPPEDLQSITPDSNSLDLIFWFDHEVSEKKPIMEWVKKNGQVLFFPESKEVSIFPFLDYLATADKKAFLELLKLKKAGFDMQYFITMVFYLLRNLAVTPKNAPQFVKSKLERQRKDFSMEKITKLYKEVLAIDFKIKSGLLEKPQAEFSLINLFGH